jgi:hypothetical protein
MNELEFIKLDNNQDYFKITDIIINNTKYYLLVNALNKNDFAIRKEESNYLIGLDNLDELNMVINKMAANNILIGN